MKAYGFIFARGGSRGLPGKNIKPMCGKPLIAWAIEAGKKTGILDRIIVSTDSEEIAAVARQFGAETPFMRPAELAADTSPEWLAWRHAVRFLRQSGDDFDLFVSLPATAPLKTAEDIRNCVDIYAQGGCDAVLTCAPAHRSPHFNMITLDSDGYARIAIQPEKGQVARRQDAPAVYDLTTVAYVASPDYILSGNSLMAGKIKACQVNKINAIDIDDSVDWEMAEHFMSKRIGSSE